MTDGPVLGVLTGQTGGFFYGGLFTGMIRAASAAGGRVVAVQTCDAGLEAFDMNRAPAFTRPVAWRHIAGFAVILRAVDRRYLERIQETGKPIVMLCDDMPGLDCPVVLGDGRPGTREAVEHLIRHGHRRIGFAGHLRPKDVRERYEAYRETLRTHGIEPDPALVFETGDQMETGGDRAGAAMLAAGPPCTAVLAGTDLNAIGIMKRLTRAGLHLPRDQAIVGFDDIEGAGCLTPTLSSIRQPFDLIGEAAAGMLLRAVAGEVAPAGRHEIPTSFVVRQSCGCSPRPPTPLDAPTPGGVPTRLSGLPGALADTLAAAQGMTASDAAALSRHVDVIAATFASASGQDPPPGSDALERALDGLYRLKPRPETLVEIAELVGRHANELIAATGDRAIARRIETATWRVVMALMHAQARAQYLDGTYLQDVTSKQYEVSMDLLSSHEEDPRTLGWLRRTQVRAGCLGLWPPEATRDGADTGADIPVHLVSMFDRAAGTGPVRQASGRRNGPSPPRTQPPCSPVSCPVGEFPPADLITLADGGAGEMVFVMPVKVDDSDWGMLALVAPPEVRVLTGREMNNQWAALLTVALNHGAVLTSLREQEARLRRAALHDGLTGLPNRTLFLDRLEHSVAAARRDPGYRYSVLFLDLDGFKAVNDGLGHAAGDRLLIQVAERLRESVRDTDTAARFGGDEFAVLLDVNGDRDAAEALALRVQRALAAPFAVDGRQITVSASIGVACGRDGYDHADDVLRDADMAMYSVKASGKGTHALSDTPVRIRSAAHRRRGPGSR